MICRGCFWDKVLGTCSQLFYFCHSCALTQVVFVFFMCTIRHHMLTLQESVPISTGKFQWCIWVFFVSMSMETASKTYGSWLSVQLIHHCIDWLQGGYLLAPLFSVLPWRHEWYFLLSEEILWGPWCSSLPTFLECLGKLEGWMLRLALKHSLDGLLHRTRAIREAGCSLHKALFTHPIPSR